jgi:hypothetical protein
VNRPPSDDDVELLEAHLDGALSPEEHERLTGRLCREAQLGDALAALRAERSVRRQAFSSFEPDPQAADAFASHAVALVEKQDRWRRTSRLLRRVSAVAAGFAIAFAGGWVARGSASADPAPTVAASGTAGGPSSIQVALTDEQGNIVAVQQFDDLRQAAQFADDVGRWQARRRQVESGQVVPVSGEF